MEKMHICMNCMHEMGAYTMCPNCGWVEGTPAKELYHLPPRTVLAGRYEIGITIGFGGFGVIYRAWDMQLTTQVAIKEYYPGGLVTRVPGQTQVVVYAGEKREQYDYGKNRFLAEARTMAKFNQQQNVVNVYDYFEANNTAYIVMEYMDGISLKDYLKSMGGKINVSEALEIMRPVMNALKAIHAEGVVHRDISPDNIFILRKDGCVKVLDFGAARLSTGDQEKTLSVVLKPGYAPPEQYRSKSKQGPFSDVYALGATLYRMVTGIVPEESVDRQVEDEIVMPNQLNPLIDKKIESVILRAMAINATLRFQTIDEMETALYGAVAPLLPEEVEIKIRKKRKRTTVFASVALISLVTLLVLAQLYFTPQQRLAVEKLEPCTVTVEQPEDETLANAIAMATEIVKEKSNGTIELVWAENADTADIRIATEANMVPPYALDLDKMRRSLDLRDYPILKEPTRYAMGNSWVSTGFDIPAMYYNVKLMSLYDIPIPYTADRAFYDKNAEVSAYCELVSPIVEVEECLPVVINTRYSGLAGNDSLVAEDALDIFCHNNGAVIYIGSLRDVAAVQKNLPGYYAVAPVPSSWDFGAEAAYDHLFYVMDSGSENNNDAALYCLSCLFSEEIQTELYITDNTVAPMEGQALRTFSQQKYPELMWLEEIL